MILIGTQQTLGKKGDNTEQTPGQYMGSSTSPSHTLSASQLMLRKALASVRSWLAPWPKRLQRPGCKAEQVAECTYCGTQRARVHRRIVSAQGAAVTNLLRGNALI